jgi:hypothetical protein
VFLKLAGVTILDGRPQCRSHPPREARSKNDSLLQQYHRQNFGCYRSVEGPFARKEMRSELPINGLQTGAEQQTGQL